MLLLDHLVAQNILICIIKLRTSQLTSLLDLEHGQTSTVQEDNWNET